MDHLSLLPRERAKPKGRRLESRAWGAVVRFRRLVAGAKKASLPRERVERGGEELAEKGGEEPSKREKADLSSR